MENHEKHLYGTVWHIQVRSRRSGRWRISPLVTLKKKLHHIWKSIVSIGNLPLVSGLGSPAGGHCAAPPAVPDALFEFPQAKDKKRVVVF